MNDSKPISDIDPSLLHRLGNIVTRWAMVDALLSEFLAFLAKADYGAMYVLTQNVSGKTLSGWVRTLAGIKFSHPRTAQHVEDLLKAIDEARAERNVLVHGLWQPGPEPGTVVVHTARWERQELVKGELATVADLDELADRIIDITHELLSLGQQLGFLTKRQPPA